MKSAMGSNSEVQNSDCHVRIGSDSVAKLGKRRLTRNNRIGAKDLLNRCCALVAVLESMLPARAPKIVLQQNRPNKRKVSGRIGSSEMCRFCAEVADKRGKLRLGVELEPLAATRSVEAMALK